jgi:hypothetical protein
MDFFSVPLIVVYFVKKGTDNVEDNSRNRRIYDTLYRQYFPSGKIRARVDLLVILPRHMEYRGGGDIEMSEDKSN